MYIMFSKTHSAYKLFHGSCFLLTYNSYPGVGDKQGVLIVYFIGVVDSMELKGAEDVAYIVSVSVVYMELGRCLSICTKLVTTITCVLNLSTVMDTTCAC